MATDKDVGSLQDYLQFQNEMVISLRYAFAAKHHRREERRLSKISHRPVAVVHPYKVEEPSNPERPVSPASGLALDEVITELLRPRLTRLRAPRRRRRRTPDLFDSSDSDVSVSVQPRPPIEIIDVDSSD